MIESFLDRLQIEIPLYFYIIFTFVKYGKVNVLVLTKQ